jgi:enoyl-CoA hydratase
MSYQNIKVEDTSGVRVLTIDRPQQLNALDRTTIDELSQALDASREDKNLRVLIITGGGQKAFIAGADIKEFAGFSVEEGRALSAQGHDRLFNKVERMNKPVIAAVNGFALGGGLELAMSCHFRIASDNARLGLPETGLGVIPGYGGTQRLARLVGRGKAMEMILVAGMIKADDAFQWGLVNQVVPQDRLLDVCREIATRIMKNSPMALAAAIRAVNAGYEPGADGMETEIEEFGNCFGTVDFKEGTAAFLEKRTANFAG